MARKILIYSPGSLGDTLMICPALNFIRRSHEDDKICLLSDLPEGRSKLTPKEILEETQLIDTFLEYRVPCSNSIFGTLVAIVKLFCSIFRKYDSVYYLVECWQGDRRAVRDQFFFKLCGISELKYFDRLQPRPSVNSKADSRAIEALYRVGDDSALKYKRAAMSYQYKIGTYQPTNEVYSRNLRYVFAPFSNMKTKDWPIERYVLIAKWLKEKFSLIPIIFGSHEDADRAEATIAQIGIGESYCGSLHFRDTRRILRNNAFYLGNDSGLMHLSAALGLPCFSIFSARDFRGRWFPLGSSHVNLRRFDIECEGCQMSICRGPRYNRCLDLITVEFCQQQLELFIQQMHRNAI